MPDYSEDAMPRVKYERGKFDYEYGGKPENQPFFNFVYDNPAMPLSDKVAECIRRGFRRGDVTEVRSWIGVEEDGSLRGNRDRDGNDRAGWIANGSVSGLLPNGLPNVSANKGGLARNLELANLNDTEAAQQLL